MNSIETDWIKKWAQYSPENMALQSVEDGYSLTYGELYHQILKMAHVLKNEFRVQKGDRVAVLSINRIEYVITFFAVQKLGAILLPLNFRLAAPELSYQLEDATPKVLIYEDAFSETIVKMDFKPEMLSSFDGETGFLQRVREADTEKEITHESDFEDPCMILYTSGTTGRPKGAIITNKMLFWNSVNTGLRLNLTQQDVTITFAPFFHTGGWNVLTTPMLHRGARLLLMKKFDSDTILRLCDEENVSILFGVPTMMDMMYRSPEFEKVSLESVRYAIVGGEPMPLNLIDVWQNKGVPIRQGYGLTEFGPNVFSLNQEDSKRKIGSIGFPNFYIDTKIMDEKGKEVPPGEAGELLLRGPVCMAGYWNNPEATAKTIRDGWLYTGDIVRCDEEGFFYVVDRKKDMYISGAENVYPAEVEHVIRKMDGIREAAVIGVPDEKWGEAGKAYIVMEEGRNVTVDEVKNFCFANLAKYKVPRDYEFLSELPKSDSGKILKKALRN